MAKNAGRKSRSVARRLAVQQEHVEPLETPITPIPETFDEPVLRLFYVDGKHGPFKGNTKDIIYFDSKVAAKAVRNMLNGGTPAKLAEMNKGLKHGGLLHWVTEGPDNA